MIEKKLLYIEKTRENTENFLVYILCDRPQNITGKFFFLFVIKL